MAGERQRPLGAAFGLRGRGDYRRSCLAALRERAVERAEFTPQHAVVRVVDVAVDVVIGVPAVQPLANDVCKPAEGEKVGRSVEANAVVARKTLAGVDARDDVAKRGVAGGRGAIMDGVYSSRPAEGRGFRTFMPA